ncbi:MAG: hypothetical protein AAF546_05275 [Verrucomicrobiota bacterium]
MAFLPLRLLRSCPALAIFKRARSIILFQLIALSAYGVEFPIRVTSWDVTPQTELATLELDPARVAEKLYLQIHNIRFGGQVSIKVNTSDWVTIYNKSPEVSFVGFESTLDGIGGINSTISFYLSLSPADIVQGGANTVQVRVNGTDGRSTTIRVLDMDFVDASGVSAVTTTLTEEDPSAWAAPIGYEGSASADEGASLWSSENILFDNIISQRPIKASCATCHFDDGSDLTYFNFSNESIISRSRFHGLSEHQGKQIAAYIRSVNLNLPGDMAAPGRPWNPPFQPGPGTDPLPSDSQLLQEQKAALWMAGKGLDAVADTDAEIYAALFPNGSDFGNIAEIVDHLATLSVRELPMTIQFPDWNQWLPDFAPEDIWDDDVMLNDIRLGNSESDPLPGYLSNLDIPVNEGPKWLYQRLLDELNNIGPAALAANGSLNNTFGDFTADFEMDWYGGMRRLTYGANENDELWQAVKPGITRDEMRESITRWRAVKAAYLVHVFDLETIQDAPVNSYSPDKVPYYRPEPLAFPTWRPKPIAWLVAPHILSDDFDRFDDQEFDLGKHMSNQWYLLQMILNTGARRPGDINLPLDWDYLGNHIQHSYDHSKHDYVMTMFINRIKTLQMRANGNGVKQRGFSLRVTSPDFIYSDANLQRDLFKGLDDLSPDLWRRFFEEYLHEFMSVMGSNNLDTMARSIDNDELEPADFVPRVWSGSNENYFFTNFAISMYRLLPLLEADYVNPALIEDFIAYLKEAFPLSAGGDWSDTPYWDEITTPENYLYLENFEDASSDFSGISNIESIKDSNYEDTSIDNGIPRNGGARYIGRRSLNTGQNVKANAFPSISLNGATKLRLACRTAFKFNNNGSGLASVRMQVRFDNGAIVNGPWVDLNPILYGEKFQTYEADISPPDGANSIDRVQVNWVRQNTTEGGSGNGRVYLDNAMVQDITPIIDTTASNTPSISRIRTIFNRQLNLKIEPSSSSDVVGYNVYRWEADETIDEAIKLTLYPHSPLMDTYQDKSPRRGETYHYAITAVDGAGNESGYSNTETEAVIGDQPDAVVPRITFFTKYVDESDQLQWFGTPNIDLFGFKVYRRAGGEASFNELTTGITLAPLFYEDPNYIEGAFYEYYVNPVTARGEEDNSASALSVGAHYSYDASKAENVVTDANSRVTQWNDISGFGWNAIPQSSETQTYPSVVQSPTGLSMIEFEGPNRLRLISKAEANNILNFATGGGAESNSGFTALCAIRFDSVIGPRNPVLATTGNTNGGFGMRVSQNGYPEVHIGGTLYQNTDVSIVGGDMVILGFTYNAASGDWTLFESKTGSTISGNTPPADFTGSKDIYAGGSGNGGHRIDGQIGEIRILKEGLAREELISDCYVLETKWISRELPIQHLNATNAGSVIGTNVVSWMDQSPSSNDATPSSNNQSSPTYPSDSKFDSGLVGIDLGSLRNRLVLFSAEASDQWLDQTAGNGFAIVAAVRVTEVRNAINDLLGNNSDPSEGFGVRFDANGALSAYLDGTVLSMNQQSVGAGDSLILGINYDATTGLFEFWDSKNDLIISDFVPQGDFSRNSSVTIGGTTNNSRYFDGIVGEVKTFGTTLSSNEFKLIQEEFADKWIHHDFDYWWADLGADIGGQTDDFDNDGMSNFAEYGLGGNPMLASEQSKPLGLEMRDGVLGLSHWRRTNAPELIYKIETSTTLAPNDWSESVFSISDVEAMDDDFEKVFYTIPHSQDSLFLRIVLEEQ